MSNSIEVAYKVASNVFGTECYAFAFGNVSYDETTEANIAAFREFLIENKGQVGYNGILQLTSNVTGLQHHSGNGEEEFKGTLTKSFQDLESSDQDIVIRDDYINFLYCGIRCGLNKTLWTINNGGGGLLGGKVRLKLDGGESRTYDITIDSETDKMRGKTPWVLVLNYVRNATGNKKIRTVATDSGFPIENNTFATADVTGATFPNESGSTGYKGSWGHTGNDLFNRLCTALGDEGLELRIVGKESANSRIMHFKTTDGISYFRTGTGHMQQPSYTLFNSGYVGNGIKSTMYHTANLPAAATITQNLNAGYKDKGDSAMTLLPFFTWGGSHFHLDDGRWTVDHSGGTSFKTFVQMWVRADS